MTRTIKSVAFAVLTLARTSAANAQVSFNVTIGAPPPPRVQRVAPMPGPEFVWVDGYWYPVGRRWVWHQGYWTRPPRSGAYWIAPYHDGRQFIPGYWEDERGRYDHDHAWDRQRDRDWRRGERRDERRDR
jgi:WXXGXW repeat (2 copies)